MTSLTKPNLLGLTNRIKDYVLGNVVEFEETKKTLPECLINISYDYKRKDAERALEIAKNMELDCKILVREIKQTMAFAKLKENLF